MTREQLEHAIRAACDVAGEDVVIVFGSQSILGQYPDASEDLRQSMEADIAPGSGDPGAADRIDGALGEASPFQRMHGFYVHGLTIDAAALPRCRGDGSAGSSWSATRGPGATKDVAWKRTTWPRANWLRSVTRTATSCERCSRRGLSEPQS